MNSIIMDLYLKQLYSFEYDPPKIYLKVMTILNAI